MSRRCGDTIIRQASRIIVLMLIALTILIPASFSRWIGQLA